MSAPSVLARALRMALVACLMGASVASAADAAPVGGTAKEASADRLQVTDPFIELRTGPGRGYPVQFVAERQEWISIELRSTDWYKVRTENGRIGWVHREQLATTLTAAGGVTTFRELLVDDYLHRRVELGAAWGQFKSEPMLKIWSAYRVSETLSVEATIGQVQGVFSGTDFWHLNLQVEPWSDQRWSPFFTVGLGKFKNVPNPSLIGAETVNANLANAGIGLRYYLSDRFVLRADYTLYTAFVADTRSLEYHALTAGISFFF